MGAWSAAADLEELVPVIRRAQSVPANATVTPFVGDQYEYLPFNAYIELALTADAVGIVATVFAGTDLLQQTAVVSQKAAPATPVYPDDYVITDHVLAGDRLGVVLQNTTAGAINIHAIARITPT